MATAPARLDRAVLRVSGPEARSWLHALLTQDLPADRPAYAALLTPQGKLLADMIAWPLGPEDIALELDPARAEAVLARLRLYKLRAKIDLARADEAFAVVAGGAGAADPRLPALGARALVPAAEAPAADPAAQAAYGAQLLDLGVPDLVRDLAAEEAFALEALLEELNGVSFQKGCFIGQENVSRMKRRATTRRKLCPVEFDGPALPAGTAVLGGAATLGEIRSGRAGRAMAFLRLDRALAALAEGRPLEATGRALRLAPPPWLILPPIPYLGEAPEETT